MSRRNRCNLFSHAMSTNCVHSCWEHCQTNGHGHCTMSRYIHIPHNIYSSAMFNSSTIKLWTRQSFFFLNLGKFDVKSDMIIKTEESKKLGAKFLDSADALSKVECLHLCCETENCDVFVYEEKVNIHIELIKLFIQIWNRRRE